MRPYANRLLLLVSSLVALALLLAAAYRENYGREWRGIQRAYRDVLPERQADLFSVQLRQIYNGELGVTDRCVTCHVGMAPDVEGVGGGHPLHSPHSDVVHNPARVGCVVCHSGQGRATMTADAHGDVPHWPEPMIPQRHVEAGCGTCHTHLSVPNLDLVDRGWSLAARYDCFSCHAIDGRGGTLRPGGAAGLSGPDLSRIGLTGYPESWYADHLAESREAETGPWRTSFGPIPGDDLAAIEALLESRVGAPQLVRAKALFHTLGCRGCHKIGGVGGDDGPDLTREGELDPHRLDYTHVSGPHTLANWQAEHLRAPGVVVPGSQMPELGLSQEQVDLLVLYLLSLRRTNAPEAYWPKDRVRAERFNAREFSTDGATLYGTFCAACHGPNGEGMRYPGMAAFPAIGNPDFLAVASDRFIRYTLEHGRTGRRMPAWGTKDGGLRDDEVTAIVAYVRSLGDGIRSPVESGPQRWVDGDLEAGAELFRANCASCHGPQGQGAEGPALNNPQLLAAATDTYLMETIRRGRRGTSMYAFGSPSRAHRVLSDREIESIVTFIRSWEEDE